MSGPGTYRLIRKIADGGMAEIFLAESLGAQGFRRTVVLKRVRQALFADPQFRNMLVDEAHIAMGLNHGNVVPVLGLGEANGRYFLAMELVDGWSLDEILTRARRAKVALPRALALHIVAQTCRALAYAHAFARDGMPLQIVHRDISPQNILLSDQGEVKLADFGIARALNKSEKTAPGVVKGKVKYMSPEQTQGAALDRRSDLFSLGTVLYLLLVDRLPFEGANDLETMTLISAARFVPANQALPTLQTQVVDILARAMSRLPADRYADADEMLTDVERVLRAAFPPTGQSELKAWLANLSALDGGLPISKVPVSAIDQAEVGDAPIELQDSDILPGSQPPARSIPLVPLPPPLSTKPRRSGWWRWVLAALVVAALAWRFEVLEQLPRLLGVPTAPPRPPPTLAEILPPLSVPPGADQEWNAFPQDEVDEAQMMREVVADAGATLIDEDQGEPQAADAGLARRTTPALAPTVMVKIASVPPGAIVRLKSRVFGQTPILLRFRSGIVFELEFFKSGFAPATKRFEVTDQAGQEVWVPLKKEARKRPR